MNGNIERSGKSRCDLICHLPSLKKTRGYRKNPENPRETSRNVREFHFPGSVDILQVCKKSLLQTFANLDYESLLSQLVTRRDNVTFDTSQTQKSLPEHQSANNGGRLQPKVIDSAKWCRRCSFIHR